MRLEMGLLAIDCLRVIGGLGGLGGLRMVGGLGETGVSWECGDSLLGAGVGFPCSFVVFASAWTSSA